MGNIVYIPYYFFMLILCFCFSTCTSGADGSTSGANASRGFSTSSRSYHWGSPSFTHYRNRLVYTILFVLYKLTHSTRIMKNSIFLMCLFCSFVVMLLVFVMQWKCLLSLYNLSKKRKDFMGYKVSSIRKKLPVFRQFRFHFLWY